MVQRDDGRVRDDEQARIVALVDHAAAGEFAEGGKHSTRRSECKARECHALSATPTELHDGMDVPGEDVA